MLIGYLYIFFGEMKIQILCLYLNVFLLLSCKHSSYVLDINPFITDMICKSFLPFGGLSFHLIVFGSTEVFAFDGVVYPFCSFVACAFGIISKKTLSNLRLQRFTPCFLLQIL